VTRILHAADLHLDAPCAVGASAPDWLSDLARDASLAAFANLVAEAERRTVEVCLLAGDLHHRRRPSLRARLAWRDGLEALHAAGVRTLLVRGNHDPLGGESTAPALPPSVTTFPAGHASLVRLELADSHLAVAGISYGRHHERAPLAEMVAACHRHDGGEPGFRIGVVHCSLDGSDPEGVHGAYAPATPAQLGSAPIDYWALGHVHRHQALRLGGTWAVYPGCLQGRRAGAGEWGAKGAVGFEVVDGTMVGGPEHVELCALRHERTTIDTSDMRDPTDLSDALAAEAGAWAVRSAVPVVLQVELTGDPAFGTLGAGEVHELRAAAHRPEQVWVDRLIDRCASDTGPVGTSERAFLDRVRSHLVEADLTAARGELPAVAAELLPSDAAMRADAEELLRRTLGGTNPTPPSPGARR
jgi:DNA repair exonuclease SbcCD nuclease subunit